MISPIKLTRKTGGQRLCLFIFAFALIAVFTFTFYRKINPIHRFLVVIAHFDGSNGANPTEGVTVDSHGNLFSTTTVGGPTSTKDSLAGSKGVVWELKAGTSAILPIASFDGRHGERPASGVTIDRQGNLFGTALNRGPTAYLGRGGAVWEIATGMHALVDIAHFGGSDGTGPTSGVTIDNNGNLLGTAQDGGSVITLSSDIWQIAADTHRVFNIAQFHGINNFHPGGDITIDHYGNLYGTSFLDNTNESANVWEILAGTSTLVDRANFDGKNGVGPVGGVKVDRQGNLFGIAKIGDPSISGNSASSEWVIWKIPAGQHAWRDIAHFHDSSGVNREAGVTLDSHGNLFGTTLEGGLYGDGVVWEVAAGTRSLVDIADFDGKNGNYPSGVTIDSYGNLYGTARYDGPNDSDGVVWELKGVASGRDTY